MSLAVQISNVSKKFILPHERYYTLRERITNFWKKKSYEEFWALKNINFKIKKGEFLGIIGRNGSGKSTLLKILSKIYQPTHGQVEVNGQISPFLELGVGFDPDSTARENIYLNSMILGMKKKVIDKKFDEIINFAELERFVDQKLKNFSSGMQMRLAFSVAIQSISEILILDEVLSVGDAKFQEKCHQVFKQLKKEQKTIIFVSHSLSDIQKYCDRVLVLDQGKIIADTSPKKAITKYQQIMQ